MGGIIGLRTGVLGWGALAAAIVMALTAQDAAAQEAPGETAAIASGRAALSEARNCLERKRWDCGLAAFETAMAAGAVTDWDSWTLSDLLVGRYGRAEAADIMGREILGGQDNLFFRLVSGHILADAQPHAAATNYKRAATHAPRSFIANNSACWTMAARLRDAWDAKPYCDRAVTLGPDHAAGWDSRATMYLVREEYDKALADYDRALRLDPQSAHARYGRGAALMGLARVTEALAEQKAALQADAKLAAEFEGYRRR